MITIKETDIQKSICQYLELKRYMFWRQNTIPALNKEGKFRAMPKYSKNGIPDIIVVKQGQFIGIEVKKPKGKQSENQIKFQKELELAGGTYYIATSIDDLIKIGL